MLTIHIQDDLETALISLAEIEHIQPEQLVKKLINDYSQSKKKKSTLMTDIINDLPSLPVFKGNPLDIQKGMRDEWD